MQLGKKVCEGGKGIFIVILYRVTIDEENYIDAIARVQIIEDSVQFNWIQFQLNCLL
jgi:hypothetical protein